MENKTKIQIVDAVVGICKYAAKVIGGLAVLFMMMYLFAAVGDVFMK